MKRAIIASILGIAASAFASFGQANFIFNTYFSGYAQVTWTNQASSAPVGEAGHPVLDSEGFKADLLWQVGTNSGDLDLAVSTSTVPGLGGGWIQGPDVSFDNSYAGQPITFTIEAWQGASWATATARGSITWVQAGVIPGSLANLLWGAYAPIFVSLIPPFLQPAIISSPRSQNATPGSIVDFLVIASGASPLTIQWAFNGTNTISGATNSVLHLTEVQLSQTGSYTAIVTNTFGAVTSSPAMLMVTYAPGIIAPPLSQFAVPGSTVEFSVSAGGSPPLTFRWFLNGTNAVTDATANCNLELTNVQSSQSGAYTVVVTNAFGSVTSSPALLSVATPSVVTNCTEAALRNAISVGGRVIFACDGTITLAGTITNTVDTVLDANGHQITISGGNSVRVFYVAPNTSLTLSGITVANGRSTHGGGIYSAGKLVIITNCVFSGNTAYGTVATNGSAATSEADGCGGAIYNAAGTLNAIGCSFSMNLAIGANGAIEVGGSGTDGCGGAIYNAAYLNLRCCMFSQNSACGGWGGFGFPGGLGGAARGGAIRNLGIMSIDSSTFARNTPAGGAGGNGGWTMGGNGGDGGAGGNGFGGALFTEGAANLINCTFAWNHASGGAGGGAGGWGRGIGRSGNPGIGFSGAIYSGDSFAGGLLINTILTSNSPGNYCGKLTDGGHNISSDNTCAFTNTGSMKNTDPRIGPLQNSGGPTLTTPPLVGSPAINAGDDSATNSLSTDQRGYPRLSGTHVDIGAVELQVVNAANAPLLNTPAVQTDGVLNFGFASSSNTDFTVLTTTNLNLPLADWSILYPVMQVSPGQYQFTDPGASNYPQRFYRVVSP